jgi:probable HAF family extracellular repeat protein
VEPLEQPSGDLSLESESAPSSSGSAGTAEPHHSSVVYPDEVLIPICSLLNQKDIPSVASINHQWKRVMDDNRLWNGYAERAKIIRKGDNYDKERDYKALVRTHCTPSFTGLGTLNGGSFQCISFDGSMIVGFANQNMGKAVLRTEESGLEFLETLNGSTYSSAQCISDDGSMFVGFADAQGNSRAVLWIAKKIESLGTLNGGRWSSANGISSDGSKIVGSADDGAAQSKTRAVLWIAKKIESLGTLSGGIDSRAEAISFDGSVIVGYSDDGPGHGLSRAFRYTAETGMESLGIFNGGSRSHAKCISFDGLKIVGSADDGTDDEIAFLWTKEGGLESLGTLGRKIGDTLGGTEVQTMRISADASVIVGNILYVGEQKGKQRPFRWTRETGMESVEQLLIDKHILPSNWQLTAVHAITPSGTILIGEGQKKVQTENGEEMTIPSIWRAIIPRKNLF